MAYTITPGVPAFAAAARNARARADAARPCAVSRVDTHLWPRLADAPERETLAAFAATGATLADPSVDSRA